MSVTEKKSQNNSDKLIKKTFLTLKKRNELNKIMNRISKPFTGLHVFGEITTKEAKKLKSLHQARRHIKNAIKKHNFHELGSFYHKFSKNGGFTGIICLSESHISIHTWPELNYLTIDVYLCNYSRDNSAAAKKVFNEVVEFFEPSKIIKRNIKR